VDNRVRELRTARGWSQQVLGEKVGVSRQTIIAIERGRYDPSLPLAFEMALIFDMKIEDLFQHRSES
jgi:putative transcriptional regulator